MKTREDLLGKCGIYCGACRLHALGRCKGCSREEHRCSYINCVDAKALQSCGKCSDFPCDRHYGQMAVYAKRYIDWKKHKINQT